MLELARLATFSQTRNCLHSASSLCLWTSGRPSRDPTKAERAAAPRSPGTTTPPSTAFLRAQPALAPEHLSTSGRRGVGFRTSICRNGCGEGVRVSNLDRRIRLPHFESSVAWLALAECGTRAGLGFARLEFLARSVSPGSVSRAPCISSSGSSGLRESTPL